jgi:REP element-mobilizing transposase RayT
MSHSYVQNHLHVVFSTEDREKLITKQMRAKLWSYMAGIARNHGFLVVANGCMEDHVHLLVLLPAIVPLAKAINWVKANSSKWMSEHGTKFAWQEGYGAFAVSKSNVDAVVRYINEQERHHRRMSFEDEFIGLLNRHGMQFDPRYVFVSAAPPGLRSFFVPLPRPISA